MARGKQWKTETKELPLRDALDYAGDIEELGGEMREWSDNTAESFPTKSEEVGECADALEEGHQAVEVAVSDIHNVVDEIDSIADAKVTFTEMRPYGRKGTPRHMTLANALAPMGAAADYLENLDADDEELEENLADHDLDVGSLQQLGGELSSALSEVESVDFPGMY
jgi:hypothetical protein